jgi:hypothetical protein
MTADEAAKALGMNEAIPELYRDMLQPAAKVMGQNLVLVARAVRVALAPVEGVVWGYDRIREYLGFAITAKLAAKPPSEIQSPDPTIAGPAIMNMVFAAEAPHLREMYATLLTHASYTPTASSVHPSFVQIIQAISPTEAKILRGIADLSGETSLMEEILFEERIDSVMGSRGTKSNRYISDQWLEFCVGCGVSNEDLAEVALRNFIRLGLLYEHTQAELKKSRPTLFDELGNEEVVNLNSIILSAYGSAFLNSCVRDI